jgi:signal transduction histidine kinase
MSKWQGRFPFRSERHYQQDPGEILFHRLRTRLTLWYCGVLGAALIFSGIALYFGAQYFLLAPAQTSVQMQARMRKQQWTMNPPQVACVSSNPQSGSQPFPPDQSADGSANQPQLVACFDPHGTLLAGQDTSELPAAFLNNAVALAALHSGNGQASDIITSTSVYGAMYRYALVVPDQLGRTKGVVVVGVSVQSQESALSLLLTLLLSIGAVALLGAGLGGLFLAQRALAPARLAWANQQRFIADASHELRTPLTLLRADAEVLLRGRQRLDVEDAALLEHIVTETNHMTHLTTNLLDLARLDSRTTHREHEVLDLTHLAQQGVERVQALAKQRGLHMHEEYTEDSYIIGDTLLLEQAILVLLDNAVKYNRPGGMVTVRTRLCNRDALLEVSDTGIGIAGEHLPHLGERFYRVDKARSRAAGGSGLGLSIAHSIALAHGGQLTLQSIPEQGTTATLLLPLARPSVKQEQK